MKRQMSWALLAGGIALAASIASAVPAAAASGSETFKGTIFLLAPFYLDAIGNLSATVSGMVLAAAADLDLDLARSWFIGDKVIDIECGRRAGTRTIQVLTGYGAVQPAQDADFRATDIAQAVGIVLGS